MYRLAEEIISTYIGQFVNLGHLAAAAAGVAALMTGLVARIVEFGQVVVHRFADRTAAAGRFLEQGRTV